MNLNKLVFEILTCTMMAFCSPVAAQDSWTGPDKKQHFALSAVFGIASGMQFANKPTAIGVAMIPGLVKELSDAQSGGSGFSIKDLVWDLIGATTGVYSSHWVLSTFGRDTTVISYRTTY